MAHIASIFKRGGQKQEYAVDYDADDEEGAAGAAAADAGQQLEQHLQQLAEAWAAPKLKYGVD